ncbi:MAG TPA: hypothetical protein VMD91_15670 [Candidatus Sulfotelmatobacter sp.]|nr:hypothetical protein [Candidatus Sulfotelmatobacter sp.]
MNTTRTLTGIVLAASLATLGMRPAPASANATGWIIGGAAAAAGTLLIINHNKKVHEKYAAYDHEVAAEQAAANNAQAAYAAEHQAYVHEAALVAEYKHETAVQHRIVVGLEQQLRERGRPAGQVASSGRAPATLKPAADGSYGWGTL